MLQPNEFLSTALNEFNIALTASLLNQNLCNFFKRKYEMIAKYNMFANQSEFIDYLASASTMLTKLKEYSETAPGLDKIIAANPEELATLKTAFQMVHEQNHLSHARHATYLLNPQSDRYFVNNKTEVDQITVRLQDLKEYKKNPSSQANFDKIIFHVDEVKKMESNLSRKLHLSNLANTAMIGLFILILAHVVTLFGIMLLGPHTVAASHFVRNLFYSYCASVAIFPPLLLSNQYLYTDPEKYPSLKLMFRTLTFFKSQDNAAIQEFERLEAPAELSQFRPSFQLNS